MDNSRRHLKYGQSHQRFEPSYVSPQCMVLLVILAIILGILNLVPGSITQVLRPLFIAVCLIFPSFGYYRSGNYKWLLILVVYYLVVFLAHPQTSNAITVFISLETFALFFFFVGSKVWTAREISLIIKVACFACAFEAAVILVSNPGMLRNSSSQHISYFSATLNRNPAAFSITPGALCGMLLMFYDHAGKRRLWFFAYGLITLLCAFTVFCLGCRSAFFSMTLGAFLIAWDAASRERNPSARANKRVFLIVASIVIVLLSSHFASGSYSERLFAIGKNVDDSGRHDIWEKTWRYIMEKPIFGGGYDNWPSELKMGTHNAFLTVMLYAGMVGGGLMALVIASFALESLLIRDLAPLAMMIQTMMHSYTEPGFDYYAYIPLCLGVILLRYSEHQSRDLRTLFSVRKGQKL